MSVRLVEPKDWLQNVLHSIIIVFLSHCKIHQIILENDVLNAIIYININYRPKRYVSLDVFPSMRCWEMSVPLSNLSPLSLKDDFQSVLRSPRVCVRLLCFVSCKTSQNVVFRIYLLTES